MKHEFSAGIVIYSQNGKRQYLLLHYEAGHWDLPKGHIEKGESKIDAAKRELLEETGIKEVTLDPDFEHSFEYFFKNKAGELILKKVYFFIGKVENKDVTLSFEHQGYEWLPFDKALKKLTYKNAQELLEVVEEYLEK